jgi:hypothetical protein
MKSTRETLVEADYHQRAEGGRALIELESQINTLGYNSG